MEARLLQNVVKLWIVKRLYEFVLFAQASCFLFLSFFSTHAFTLLVSLSSLSPLSVRYIDSLPSFCGWSRDLCASLDTDGLTWNIFLSCDQRNLFICSFVRCGDLDSARFTPMDMDFCHKHSIDAAKMTSGWRQLIVVVGFIRAMLRYDHRKTYLLTSCRYVRQPHSHIRILTQCARMPGDGKIGIDSIDAVKWSLFSRSCRLVWIFLFPYIEALEPFRKRVIFWEMFYY